MKTWKPEVNESYFFAEYDNSEMMFVPTEEIYDDWDNGVIEFDIFKTVEDCQGFCDKLNEAVNQVRNEYRTHLL